MALLGDPARHSLSPTIHNEACKAAGADYRYLAFEPGNLEMALRGLLALGARGCNLTMPYKRAVIPFLDTVDAEATLCQSVNTVVMADGRMTGYTTDGRGFVEAVRSRDIDPAGRRVTVLGTGAACASILTAMRSLPGTTLTVYGRPGDSFHETEQLCTRLDSENIRLGYLSETERLRRDIRDADILVNTSSVGMNGKDSLLPSGLSLHRRQVVADIIYEPAETPLLVTARRSGCKYFNGLEMLIQQARLSFEYWTGEQFNLADVRVAVAAEMARRNGYNG